MLCQVDLLRPFDPAAWPADTPLSVYGSGYAGRLIRLLLAEHGIRVERFLDYAGSGEVDGLPLVHLAEETGPVLPLDTPILVAASAFIRPANRLRTLGYRALWDGYHGLYQRRGLDGMAAKARGALALLGHAIAQRCRTDSGAIAAAREAVIGDLRRHGPYAPQASQTSISMMPHEVHAAVQLLTRLFPGPVLEIGTYVGGLTATIAGGLAGTGHRQILLERGGSTYAHESAIDTPTDDIIRDLRHNLAVLAPSAEWRLIEDSAQSPVAARLVTEAAEGHPIRLFVMDADGDARDTYDRFVPLLHPACILILDDFVDSYPDPAKNKGERTRRLVYDMIRSGAWTELGICHGTWFGCRCDARSGGGTG